MGLSVGTREIQQKTLGRGSVQGSGGIYIYIISLQCTPGRSLASDVYPNLLKDVIGFQILSCQAFMSIALIYLSLPSFCFYAFPPLSVEVEK